MIATAKQYKAYLLPIPDANDIVGGIWRLPILQFYFLKRKDSRPYYVKVRLHPKVLPTEVKTLAMNYKRTVVEGPSITVKYSITGYGKSLRSVIEELQTCGSNHRRNMADEHFYQSCKLKLHWIINIIPFANSMSSIKKVYFNVIIILIK